MNLNRQPPIVQQPAPVIEPQKPDPEQAARQRLALDRRRVGTEDLFVRPTKTGIKA